jgi:hypothetical protein
VQPLKATQIGSRTTQRCAYKLKGIATNEAQPSII